jgi:hypothetical protein
MKLSVPILPSKKQTKTKELNAGALPLIIACEGYGWVWRKGYEN